MAATWEHQSGLARELDALFTRAIQAYKANPSLIEEHANLEESIRVGGYANRTLLELAQNAADAMTGVSSAGSVAGRIEIVLDERSKTFYCANSGRSFSAEGLRAMSHAHLSAKRGDEIGRFGLGFKSVLAVTDSPQIISRSVSFEFNSERARTEMRKISRVTHRLPILRTATLLDTKAPFRDDPILRDLSSWATTIVLLPHIKNAALLRAEMTAFASEFLLFVEAVREIRLRIIGPQPDERVYISRDLGGGRYKIEQSDGNGDEWIVGTRMHTPSPEARREVGEAVSRDQLKVSVAIPAQYSQRRMGKFWSYFPLHDDTSATGLFNAPWSVNDDRTTLLRNGYNREILRTLAEIFVELLPQVVTAEDPAAPLDYLPARGREATYFGDEVLCEIVPRLAVTSPVIADAQGVLRTAPELRPLDFLCGWKIPEEAHRAWVQSPNTGNDVPHWRCYNSPQRVTRLRQLFAVSTDPDAFEHGNRDMARALERVRKRGILSWLREWAEGSDVVSAVNALKLVMANRGMPEAEKASVIPTTNGLRSLGDRHRVYLRSTDDLAIEDAVFVSPTFLAHPEIPGILQRAGFHNLDPAAILRAHLAHLTPTLEADQQTKFWAAAREVGRREAIEIVNSNSVVHVHVPTQDGQWGQPGKVVDLGDIPPGPDSGVLLDRTRCVPDVAYALGVVTEPQSRFEYGNEFRTQEYEDWLRDHLNGRRRRGEPPIGQLAVRPESGVSRVTPGPFSVLLLLRDAEASDSIRESWTRRLLEFGDGQWECRDLTSGNIYSVISPVRWAVQQAGVLNSSLGYRPIGQLVAPSLVRYDKLLPLYRGPASIVDELKLPDEIERVQAEVLRDALAVEELPPGLPDEVLVDFILRAAPVAYPSGSPPAIPARVGRIIESRPTRTVHVAVTDEQRDYLAQRQRPYLLAAEDQASELVETIGCLRFEDSFAFSMNIAGAQEAALLLDVFPGLRSRPLPADLASATIVRAESVAKWVTTEDGVETQSVDSHLDGLTLTVRNGLDERRTLVEVNAKFGLGLNNFNIEQVLQAGLDHRREHQREEARAAPTDAARIEVYFGADDLREKLPKGLWQGLEAQGLVSATTSVAELCLSVYGKDTVRHLADLFRRDGFADVPLQWVGGAATISWLRKMGFGAEFAGQRTERQDAEFIVPGATVLPSLHDYQVDISEKLRRALTEVKSKRRTKAMVVLPTGAGKTRVATQTVLELFIEGKLRGPVLWIAQSQELCEQAVQTFSTVWRGLGDERPLSIGRLWDNNEVHEPDTAFSVIVATDAKVETILGRPDYTEYDWLARPTAVFVDEAHVAGDSPRYTRILAWLGVDGRNWARPLIGLSATPFKGTSADRTRALASRFGNNVIQAFGDDTYGRLVSLGILARVKHRVLEGTSVRLTADEENDAKQFKRISLRVLDKVAADHNRMRKLVDDIRGLDPERARSVLVFTPNVLSAQVLAAMLRFHKVEAAAVSGETGRQERRDLIGRFKKGEIQVLANCDLLTQGFDAPGVSTLYIARPTFSRSAYIQMAGRGLRGPRNGGKEECLIVDLADNFGSSDIDALLGFREYEELWKEQQA